MAAPTTPSSITALLRVLEIIKGIAEGSTYWYSVGENAVLGLRLWTEARGYPFDMIYFGADHREPEHLPDHYIHRYPTIIIAAYVDAGGETLPERLGKHLRDVQLAVETDLRSTESGSLGQICAWGHLGSVVTDEGELGLEGVSGFRLDLQLCLEGDWGDI